MQVQCYLPWRAIDSFTAVMGENMSNTIELLETIGSDASLPLDLTETLLESAIDECERFYPVFQFVLWGGKSPAEALAASLIETRGEA